VDEHSPDSAWYHEANMMQYVRFAAPFGQKPIIKPQ
jgi:hypothetical protein